jgi:hypothetical protein
MKRFVEGEDRSQSTLFPERLDDYICEDNPVRVVEAFVLELDLGTTTCFHFRVRFRLIDCSPWAVGAQPT